MIGPDDESLALTAAHVVGSLSPAHGAETIEVRVCEVGAPRTGDERLGFVRESHPEDPCDEIEIDASLIELEDRVEIKGDLRRTQTSARPVDLSRLSEEIPVYKLGMSTGLTSGMLDPEPRSLSVEDGTNCQRLYVRGYYVVGTDEGPFAEPGDSGAIVVDEDECVVGMVVAVRLKSQLKWRPDPDDPALVIAMTDILDALDFRLKGPDRACTER